MFEVGQFVEVSDERVGIILRRTIGDPRGAVYDVWFGMTIGHDAAIEQIYSNEDWELVQPRCVEFEPDKYGKEDDE